MQAERSKVLEMLAAGTVTVEQATQLLDAIGWGEPDPGERRHPETQGAGASGRGASGRRQQTRVPRFTTEEVIELANHGVTPAYVRELWDAGFRDLTVDELTELANHGVTGHYLQELHAAGLTELNVDEVTELANHGVGASYVHELRDAGYEHLSVEEVIELANHGVTTEYLREMEGARAPLTTSDAREATPGAKEEA